jgi:hypothetical protein
MAGQLRNVPNNVPTRVQFRDGSMHCMIKVVNPTGRTRNKGKFVCNSMCQLPTKRPSRKCGYGGGQFMPQLQAPQQHRMLGYGGGGF